MVFRSIVVVLCSALNYIMHSQHHTRQRRMRCRCLHFLCNHSLMPIPYALSSCCLPACKNQEKRISFSLPPIADVVNNVVIHKYATACKRSSKSLSMMGVCDDQHLMNARPCVADDVIICHFSMPFLLTPMAWYSCLSLGKIGTCLHNSVTDQVEPGEIKDPGKGNGKSKHTTDKHTHVRAAGKAVTSISWCNERSLSVSFVHQHLVLLLLLPAADSCVIPIVVVVEVVSGASFTCPALLPHIYLFTDSELR